MNRMTHPLDRNVLTVADESVHVMQRLGWELLPDQQEKPTPDAPTSQPRARRPTKSKGRRIPKPGDDE